VSDAPTGTVTLLFTDIQGSTQMLHRLGDGYPAVLAEHRRLLRAAFAAHGGYEVDTQGDAFFIAFADAVEGVAAAIEAQRALACHEWPNGDAVRVRMGMHTGTPVRTDEGYAGVDLHRGARVASAGHGGQVVLTQTTAELVRDALPAGVTLKELGYHRLKDLTEPELLFQPIVPDLENDFPSLRSLRTGSNNLPAQTTSFVGREDDIERVKLLLGDSRLLTLLGPAGMGKTRLALRVAGDLLERHRDGVWFADCSALTDPALVPDSVARAVSVREEPGKPIATVLVEALQSRHLMLVIDNCEHLIEACAALLDLLLINCPSVTVLATSREALRIRGESLYRLRPLALPEDVRRLALSGARGFEAVRLFAERAAAVVPGFEVSEQNAGAVVEVCRQLDGIPLAIELAAARVRVLSPSQIAERLADRFRLLTGGSRTAQARQQTLRGAIDWSYSLLNEAEKIVLRRLSVFSGGWSIEAAEAVCADDALIPGRSPELGRAENDGEETPMIDVFGVLDLITELSDKSLLTTRVGDADSRYGMLESIRQYAGEKLAEASSATRYGSAAAVRGYASERLIESGEAGLVRGRHREWYLALAERAEPELEGPEQSAWLERLETEHDNLRAALDWSCTCDDGSDAAPRLAAAQWKFWEIRGHVSEGRQALERALAADPNAPAELRASALRRCGWLARTEGELSRASERINESIDLYRELDDASGLSWSLSDLANVQRELGHHERAVGLWEESLELRRRSPDKLQLGVALGNAGLAARDGGNYDRAIGLYTEALGLFRDLQAKARVAWMLNNLAGVMVELHEYHRAAELCDEALPLAEELQDRRRLAWLRRIQGMVQREQGDIEQARNLLHDSLGRFEEMKDRQGIAYCLRELAATATVAGRPADAARLLEAEARMREAAGFALTPDLNARRDRYLAETRAALGDEAFETAWAASHALSVEAAVASALHHPDPA